MKKLPKGYKRLKYIESTGTQYIDTGFKPNQNTMVVMDALVTDTTATGWLFCGRTAASNAAFGLYSYADTAKIYFVYGTESKTFSTSRGLIRQIYSVNKNVATVSGEVVTATAQTFTSSANLTLLARNTAGTIASYALARLYSCQIYDNGTLIRDYAPCMDSNGVAGLYDFANDVFYTNAGTGTFVAGPEYNPAHTWVLPKGYSRLEYIQSSGTQYIDTGFKPNQNTCLVADMEVTSGGTTFLFGSRHNSSANSTSYSFSMPQIGGERLRSDFGSAETSISVSPLQRLRIDKNKNVTTVNGTSVTATAQTFQSSYELTLFAVNTAGTKSTYTAAKLYSCKIYDNGTLARNFVPCKDPSGAIGLYDVVNDVFYGNAGTGTFTAGPEFGYQKVEYIESSGTQYIDTGFIPNQDTRVVVTFETQTSNGDYRAIFAARTTGNNADSVGFYLSTSNVFTGFYGAATTISFSGIDYSGVHTVDWNKNSITVDNVTKTTTAQTFSSACPLFLCAVDNAGTVFYAHFLQGKIYSCQIYDNGILARELIPVVDTNGVAGLWDNVHQIFYGNAGTGTFAAGAIIPDVPDEPDEPEVEPPLTPESISVPYVDFANAVVLWAASAGATEYKVLRDGEQVAVTEYPFYFDNDLQMESTYNYAITAVNEGGESEAITINTETTKFKLITDRTASDVQEVITAIQTGTLPNNWFAGMKGAYNATDLNRVESAVIFVIERLKIAGWYLTVMSKTDWSFTDFPSASEMRRYLENVALLRSALPASMPAMPLDTDKFNFEEANTIEQILELLDATVTNIMLNVYYSNEIYSGEV